MITLKLKHVFGLAVMGCASIVLGADSVESKKLLLIAGSPSHLPGAHEMNAVVLLFQKSLAQVPGLQTDTSLNGWPTDAAAFDDLDAVVFYCDGWMRHLLIEGDRLKIIGRLVESGVGIGFLHYAAEPPLERGQNEFFTWVGGAFEPFWSVNPKWKPEFQQLPDHPVTRGVGFIDVFDEWYCHFRFNPGAGRITPLLVAIPSEATLTRPDGIRSGNPAFRASAARREPQTLSWAYQRSDGGRGFVFGGGHFHRNWGDDNYRKLVLNAFVWLSGLDVPMTGVRSSVTESDLAAHLDHKPPPAPPK